MIIGLHVLIWELDGGAEKDVLQEFLERGHRQSRRSPEGQGRPFNPKDRNPLLIGLGKEAFHTTWHHLCARSHETRQEGSRHMLCYNSRLSWVSLGAGLAVERGKKVTRPCEPCNVTAGSISTLGLERERLHGGMGRVFKVQEKDGCRICVLTPLCAKPC